MRVLIMGAGGVGGYFGGVLARAGADVWFVARGPHLTAMRERGLAVRSFAGEFALRVNATDEPRNVADVDVVLFCVKTYETEDALDRLSPAIGKRTMVLPLQNGVESAAKIEDSFGLGHAFGGLAYIESFVASPGVIEQRSQIRRIEFGELDGSVTDRAKRVLDLLRRAGIDAHVRTDIDKALWEKLAWIAPGGGMTAVTRSPIGDVLASHGTREMFISAIREVQEVAWANEVPADADLVERTVRFAEGLEPVLKTSMQRDVEAGNRLEVDALNGAVVRFGAKRSVPTPTNRFIHSVLTLEDEKNRRRIGRQG